MSVSDPVPVLLVDDLPANLLALQALLEGENVTILKAQSGMEALELLLSNDVALALLDVQMPEMDGFELAELMRGSERTRHVPIVFVTAGASDALRRFRGYEAGAVDFIAKPIEPDILRSKARVFFDLYRQRRQIAEQRDELAVAAAALRQADANKDRFLAVLAHELRNPVAALMSGLDLLNRPRAVGQADEIRERMGRTLFHLSRLVEDLLDVSRVSEGKVSLKLGRVDVSTIVASAVEGSRHNIEAAGHRLTINMQDVPIEIEGDHTRLAQVFANLLSNAAKYTPDGGNIALSARIVDDAAELRVTDDGLGIAPEKQDHVFDMFMQVDDHRRSAQGGLGIGLALVRQLVELHQGTIRVESPGVGQGCSFIVTLPLAKSHSEQRSPSLA